MVLSAMTLMAAENNVIQVTTFEDQNGEDLTKVLLMRSVGGCKRQQGFLVVVMRGIPIVAAQIGFNYRQVNIPSSLNYAHNL